MNKTLIGITGFISGVVVGCLLTTKQEDLKELIEKEKIAINKFKKNPKNKGFLKIFNKK